MAEQLVKAGTTDVSTKIFIFDSTTGAPETAVEHDTSGIDLWYWRFGGTKTSITEAALAALDSAHSDGGIEHCGNGEYRLDLPDAACATGAKYVQIGGTVTGMIVIGPLINLVAFDPFDAVRMGMTALPNAAADAAGGLPISDAGSLDIDAKLANTNEVTAARMGALTDWINGGRLDLILDTIAADTTTDIPATLTTIAGYIDTEVGTLATELAKVPKSDSNVTWNATALASINAEVDSALNTAIPGSPTADSINERIVAIAVDVAGLDGAAMRGTDSAALASVCTEARLSELDAATSGKMANQVDIIQTDTTTDIPAILGTPAGASMSADIAAIEAQTDDIGVAGAGLTAVPWNAAWDAEVESEVFDALNAAFTDATALSANGLLDRIRTLGWLQRNKVTVTDANGNTVFFKDDSTTQAFSVNAALTDDSTTTTRLRIA